MGKIMRALGLMSGTSLDGIDVALIDTDGEAHVVRGPSMTFPYSADTRQLLVSAIVDAKGLTNRDDRPGSLPRADLEITEHHGAAVSGFLRKQGIARASIDVIGFHGQTVLHKSPTIRVNTVANGVPFEVVVPGLTLQLGLGDMLADLTRCRVVYDLRAADVAAGGQGAPLVPVYHQALTAHLDTKPIAVVNIGGVANVTWIGRNGDLVAFDTGPGNALIDDWVRLKAGLNYDEGGALAGRGKVDEMIVSKYLSEQYFRMSGPKSMDRNAFSLDLVDGLPVEDGAATLTEVTARAIALAGFLVPEHPELWIIAGGGRRNRTLMGMLAGLVQHAVVPAEAAGLNGDSLEAEAWAYLAVRSLKGLPITFPGTTGVSAALTGGILAAPKTHLVN